MRSLRVLSSLAVVTLAANAVAQTLPIPLNYNFNGIVHAGESGTPDAANGFRSISDRALDFSFGIPSDPLLANYTLVTTPGTLDIVHLGNRNTVDGGSKVFDAVVDNDDIGIQPSWLTTVDQSTPQTTTLAAPLPITPTTACAFLYQISNGGGSFDVTFTTLGGVNPTFTMTLSGPDWFGGVYPGTQNVDNGFTGNNLSITEGRLNLGAHAGEVITAITFQNRSNANAGYAILAANIEYPPTPRRVNQIALSYNFNGIVHAGETGAPDALAGYRSISDRGLDFTAGIPNNPMLQPYALISAPNVLDIVHLGDRNTVDGGSKIFDAVPDNDDIGVQPAWLAITDQSTPQTTTLAREILLDNASAASFLFQISNGGGSFDVTFGFRSGNPLVATLSGGDWFGGVFAATDHVDSALTGAANLSITERNVDLSAQAGRILTSITFSNRSNTNAGYAILAANVSGCLACANNPTAAVNNLGGGNGPVLSTTALGNLGCDIDLNVSGATPSTFVAFMALDLGSASIPLSILSPACSGTIHVPNPVAILLSVNASGSTSLLLPGFTIPAACGATLTSQYAEFVNAACPLRISNALAITIGN